MPVADALNFIAPLLLLKVPPEPSNDPPMVSIVEGMMSVPVVIVTSPVEVALVSTKLHEPLPLKRSEPASLLLRRIVFAADAVNFRVPLL